MLSTLNDEEAQYLDAQTQRGLLAIALDLAPLIILTVDGRISVWNTGAERLYGWPRDEVIGRAAHELLSTVFPKPLAEIKAELERRGEWQGELQQHTRDGRTIYVSSYWALHRDSDGTPLAVVEASNDITERHQAEEERLWLATTIDSSHSAVIRKTLGGIITNWNKGAAEMFGYPAEEILGRSDAILFPPDRRGEDHELFKLIREGKKVDNYETVRRRKDGVDLPVSIIVAPIRDPGGTIVGTSVIMRDITERRERELRLRHMQSELAHMSRLTELGQMIFALAHEVNQPLTAIGNYAQAARQFINLNDEERAQVTLRKLIQEVDRAGEMIRRLRGFLRKTETQRDFEDVTTCIEEASALALMGTGTSGVTIDFSCDPELRPVAFDKVQIQQVLFNLMKNAIEAMAEGPRRELKVAATALSDGGVEISVADTGPGLAEEVRENLFQPFVTTKEDGMGLGLSICRSIIDAHGGQLWAEDNPGGGTLFRFSLPAMSMGPLAENG